jgi:LMBR1 domain-containing protein 1
VHSIRRSSLWIQQLSDTPATGGSCGKACIAAEITWKISVTFPIYVMAFLSFLGWFFFAIFAGVGLIALPIDLVNEYRTRPVSMSTREFFEQRQDLGERAGFLIEAGAALQKAEDKAVMTRKETKEHCR